MYGDYNNMIFNQLGSLTIILLAEYTIKNA